jgi:hypothetical protein
LVHAGNKVVCPVFKELNMRKNLAFSIGILIFLIFPICSAMAQSFPPPPCCPRDPIQDSVIIGGLPSLGGDLVISNQTLQAAGMTRDQLLNAISASVFPGKNVDLVLISKQIVSKPALVGSTWAVMATEETVYYTTSRASITTDYLNAVTEIGLTDGTTWIKISFQDDIVDTE